MQYGLRRSHLVFRSKQAKQSSAAPVAGALLRRLRGPVASTALVGDGGHAACVAVTAISNKVAKVLCGKTSDQDIKMTLMADALLWDMTQDKERILIRVSSEYRTLGFLQVWGN